MGDQFKILVVDSDATFRESLVSALHLLHPLVMQAGSAEDGLEVFRREVPAIVFVDVNLPGASGVDFTRTVSALSSHVLVAVVTEPSQARLAIESIKAGAHDYLQKPVTSQELKAVYGRFAEILSRRNSGQLQPGIVHQASIHLELQSSTSAVAAAVQQVVGLVHGLVDEREAMRVELALHEMIHNALEHGNLGVTCDEKIALCETGGLEAILAERSKVAIGEGKLIVVDAALENGTFTCSVADEGKGFDWRKSIDPTESIEKLSGLSGRGLFLIRKYFDSVEFNDQGNRITVAKRFVDSR